MSKRGRQGLLGLFLGPLRTTGVSHSCTHGRERLAGAIHVRVQCAPEGALDPLLGLPLLALKLLGPHDVRLVTVHGQHARGTDRVEDTALPSFAGPPGLERKPEGDRREEAGLGEPELECIDGRLAENVLAEESRPHATVVGMDQDHEGPQGRRVGLEVAVQALGKALEEPVLPCLL